MALRHSVLYKKVLFLQLYEAEIPENAQLSLRINNYNYNIYYADNKWNRH